MALDHYVSQVHLRNFYSSALDRNMMYGVQKRTLKQFPCRSEDVCRIEDGNTNDYLIDKRVIEQFLEYVEPYYNKAIDNFRNGNIDPDSIFVVAGFASYIMSCAPATMRLNSDWLKKTVESTDTIMDRQGLIPPPPKELGGNSISELLNEDVIKAEIDGKYPQALGITGIFDRTIKFGNSDWDILINTEPDSPFFTSDFPVAIERSQDPRILNRIMPLAPDLAVRIKPNFTPPPKEGALNFPLFSYQMIKLKHRQVCRMNELIVRCAEEQVYYRDEKKWVLPFIKKNAGYWIEPITKRIPSKRGEVVWSTMRVTRRE